MIYVGLVWDAYTPAVEAQITRDLIALQQKSEIVVISDSNEVDRALAALGIKHGIGSELVDVWIVYQTTKEKPYVETSKPVIDRCLYQERVENRINPKSDNGYYLHPQGRWSQPRISQAPMPNRNGQTDPAVIYLWS